jgi:multiple sugar transport system substrate-binding protein
MKETRALMMRWVLLLLVVTALLGCGSKKSNKVVFFVGGAPNELEAWESLVKDFERESGISVELLRQPSNTDQQRQSLIVSLDAKLKNPDVFLMDVAWVGLFACSGWLEPLRNIDLTPYFERVVQQVDTYKGNVIALPVYMDGGLLYFRRDLLEKYHIGLPPETWSDLLNDSLEVQSQVRLDHPAFYGFVWQGAEYEGLICNFLEFAGTQGGFIFKGDRVRLDTAENRRAVQFMHDLIWKYKVSPPNTYTEMREEQTRLYFQAGHALFERNWPYAWNLHQERGSEVKDKTGIAPFPAPPSGESVSTLGGWHIAISKYSEVKEQALAFVKYVTSYKGQKKMVLLLGWNPGRQDLYHDGEVLKKMPFLMQLKDIFAHARARPVVPYYPQISDIAQRWINAALAGRYTPEDALQRAEKEVAALLARYGITGGNRPP